MTDNTDKTIYNCHIHLFTHENVPNKFLPLLLIPAARFKSFRWLLTLAMKAIIPWSERDIFHRSANFINVAYSDSQEDTLKKVMELYPPKTRFVVLPMDMENMLAGKVMEDIDGQHEELATLYKDYSDIVIPFAHVDPRKDDALDRLKSLVEDDGFKGVKIYPPHGYSPAHKVLMEQIYPYMVEKNIPLMTHCMPGPGIITSRGISSEKAKAYTDPNNYKAVLEKYPELKICLGHFGGIDAWKKYNENPNEPTWLTKICNLMKDYPNLYADISYTISNFEESIKVLTTLLNNKTIADRILFGSDFFMIKPTVHSEEDLYKKLQYSLGEDKFWKIANSNPKRYLQHKPVIKPAAKPVAKPVAEPIP